MEVEDSPSLIIHVYGSTEYGIGYTERLRLPMEKNANGGGIQVPGYKATGLTVDPRVSELITNVSVAAVRGDEQGFHIFVIPCV